MSDKLLGLDNHLSEVIDDTHRANVVRVLELPESLIYKRPPSICICATGEERSALLVGLFVGLHGRQQALLGTKRGNYSNHARMQDMFYTAQQHGKILITHFESWGIQNRPCSTFVFAVGARDVDTVKELVLPELEKQSGDFKRRLISGLPEDTPAAVREMMEQLKESDRGH